MLVKKKGFSFKRATLRGFADGKLTTARGNGRRDDVTEFICHLGHNQIERETIIHGLDNAQTNSVRHY